MKKICLLLAILSSAQLYAKEYIVMRKSDHRVGMYSAFNVRREMENFKADVLDLNEEQAKKMEADGFEIEPNGRMYILGKPDVGTKAKSAQEVPWGVVAVKARDAAKKRLSGKGIVVCVVDTGADRNHPALKKQIIGGASFVSSVSGEYPFFDDNGHGTHVSGTIAASSKGLVGVAPDAKLYVVKVLGADGGGNFDAIADGILECVKHKAQVINLSLGGPEGSRLVRSAIAKARASGVYVVAAAGNDHGPVDFPASYPEAIAVSAVDSVMRFAKFSNFGPEVDFAAPGVGVISSVPGGGYRSYNGTSMAAPHVSGVLAIMLSAKKSDPKARKIKGLAKTQQGAGFIDALLSVN